MRYLSESDKYVAFELDTKIRDTSGGYSRQIDVWLPRTREIVECKHLTRPVVVGVVDSLIGVVQDINAAGGHIFSSSGFSRQAELRAQKAGIKCTTLPFENRLETLIVPSGNGHYVGDYIDLCMGRARDCDLWGRINYADADGDQSPICVGLSIDWGNAKMIGFAAYILLSHFLGRPPSDSAIDGFVSEYEDRFDAGQEWIISEQEVSHFAIAEVPTAPGRGTARAT